MSYRLVTVVVAVSTRPDHERCRRVIRRRYPTAHGMSLNGVESLSRIRTHVVEL